MRAIRPVGVAAFVHTSLSKHTVQDDGVQSDVDVPEDPAHDHQLWAENASMIFKRVGTQCITRGSGSIRQMCVRCMQSVVRYDTFEAARGRKAEHTETEHRSN